MASRLPPGCGALLDKPLLYNPFQQAFQSARRQRFCLACKKFGSMNEQSEFVCTGCQRKYTSNLDAPRLFNNFLILAGRRGGKTAIGAHAAREEALVPKSLGWVMGPTYKILHDSTFPTLVGLIPPAWVKHWDGEHMDLTLVNDAKIAFRSLEDPERARGPGPDWGWFDEAALIDARAWDVFSPSLAEKAGIAFFTTTVAGFDWTYKTFEVEALVKKTPGYWACRYKTLDNPIFKHPVLQAKVESDRKRMSPEFFAQEYEAQRHNFTGAIYDSAKIDAQILEDDDAVRALIPEWPNVATDRIMLVGLDSGADHPFGAVCIVVTTKGLVVVGEYLRRQRAAVEHLGSIQEKFGTRFRSNITWSANKNEAQLRLEFGLRGVGVVPAENKQDVGIQRVQSWLYSKQLWFVRSGCPLTIEQMKQYRYAENTKPGGEKKEKENVFKKDDELPDGIRYALMAWPELPPDITTHRTDEEQVRWDSFDDKTKRQIERHAEYLKSRSGEHMELQQGEAFYPVGDFFGHEGDEGDVAY